MLSLGLVIQHSKHYSVLSLVHVTSHSICINTSHIDTFLISMCGRCLLNFLFQYRGFNRGYVRGLKKTYKGQKSQ
jgi:hypothetical protein